VTPNPPAGEATNILPIANDRAWETQKIKSHSGHAFGMLHTLVLLGPLVEDPDGQEDEFGCRDGLDGIVFGAGDVERKDLESGLWALDRLGWAKLDAKRWKVTEKGRAAQRFIDDHVKKPQPRELITLALVMAAVA